MAGDDETGVSIMKMETGLDTGPVCMKKKIPITPTTTAATLHDQLARLGAELIVESLEKLENKTLDFTPQPQDGITYARKITKSEAHIDFARPANAVIGHIHGLSPFPGAWLDLPVDGKNIRIKLLEAEKSAGKGEPGTILDDRFTIACKQGAIVPTRLQRQGKAAMDLETFLRGTGVRPGTIVE